MTASKTPNLGLLNPVASDPFQTTDFANTMGIIDQNPGIMTVPNQASRPTGYTSAQHGRRVWQTDQNIEWTWAQPSSGSPGFWQRVGPRGSIASSWSGAQISTSTTNRATGVTVGEFKGLVIPGGRPLKVGWMADWIGNSAGVCMFSFWENNVRVTDIHHTGFTFSAGQTIPHAQGFFLYRFPGGNQQSIDYRLTMAAHEAWGGTSSCWGVTFYVEEV